MLKAVNKHIGTVIDWANACGNVSFKKDAERNRPISSNCCAEAPALFANPEATSCEALLGAGAHALVSLYMLVLTAVLSLPFMVIGALLLLTYMLMDLCCVQCETLRKAGRALILCGLSFVGTLYTEIFSIFATLAAHCSKGQA